MICDVIQSLLFLIQKLAFFNKNQYRFIVSLGRKLLFFKHSGNLRSKPYHAVLDIFIWIFYVDTIFTMYKFNDTESTIFINQHYLRYFSSAFPFCCFDQNSQLLVNQIVDNRITEKSHSVQRLCHHVIYEQTS